MVPPWGGVCSHPTSDLFVDVAGACMKPDFRLFGVLLPLCSQPHRVNRYGMGIYGNQVFFMGFTGNNWQICLRDHNNIYEIRLTLPLFVDIRLKCTICCVFERWVLFPHFPRNIRLVVEHIENIGKIVKNVLIRNPSGIKKSPRICHNLGNVTLGFVVPT
jgi:hypothetical protein